MTVVSTKSTVSRRAPGWQANEDQAVLAAAGHLTERDRYLVRLTGQHRVLTTDQLCALGFDSIITARHRLGVLVGLGMLRRFRPRREVGSAPWHYLLGPVGAALLGAEDRDDRKWVPQVRADRQLALERSQQLAHLTGRNWFFVALARHARHSGGQLRAWLNEAESAGRYAAKVLGGYGDRVLPRPDGAGTWAERGREVTFLLEYDAIWAGPDSPRYMRMLMGRPAGTGLAPAPAALRAGHWSPGHPGAARACKAAMTSRSVSAAASGLINAVLVGTRVGIGLPLGVWHPLAMDEGM